MAQTKDSTSSNTQSVSGTSLEGNILPTSVQQIGIVTKYELLNYFRSRRFFILLVIGLIISALLTFIVAYYRPVSFLSDYLTFYSSWWGMSVTFVVILSGIFFGGDAISGEFQNKTGYFLVGNPLRRSSIYIGKWLAALVASLIVFGVFTAITVANGVYYLGTNIPYQFGESFLFALLYLIAVLGFTFFFSSLFKSSAMSILVTAILFLFAFTLIETVVSDLASIEPWFIITYGAGIIGNVLESPYPAPSTTTHVGRPEAGFNLTSYAATIPEGIAILLCYFAITAILGLIIFERREFT
jgi:ABC-2 type transport system permease protein